MDTLPMTAPPEPIPKKTMHQIETFVPRTLHFSHPQAAWDAVLASVPAGLRAMPAIYMSRADRHYHDVNHCGRIWDAYLATGGDPTDMALALATLWHDIIILEGAKKGENEEASAIALAQSAKKHGIDSGVLDRALRMIRATANHARATGYWDQRFCDLDLCGLATDWEGFVDDTRRLRRESPHLDDATYDQNRRAFLKSLLADAPIFQCRDTPTDWEQRAQENIRRSLEPGFHWD